MMHFLKSKFLFSFVLFCSAHFSFSQSANTGVKLGPNIATIGGDSEGNEAIIGFQAGYFAEMGFAPQWKLRPELQLSLQGSKLSEHNDRYNYWYFNFPVLLDYKINVISLRFGPQIGTVVKANGKNKGIKEDVTAQLNNVDFSLVAGLGVQLSDRISLEGRYNFGISNTSRNPYFDGGKFYNRVVQVSIEYYFNK